MHYVVIRRRTSPLIVLWVHAALTLALVTLLARLHEMHAAHRPSALVVAGAIVCSALLLWQAWWLVWRPLRNAVRK